MGVRQSSGAVAIGREHVKVPTNTFTHDIVLHQCASTLLTSVSVLHVLLQWLSTHSVSRPIMCKELRPLPAPCARKAILNLQPVCSLACSACVSLGISSHDQQWLKCLWSTFCCNMFEIRESLLSRCEGVKLHKSDAEYCHCPVVGALGMLTL